MEAENNNELELSQLLYEQEPTYTELSSNEIWDYIIKWDIILSRKIIKERKVVDFCHVISSIPEITHSMIIHKMLLCSSTYTNHIIVYHRNEVSMYLANAIYHAIYPFHKSEIPSHEHKNWKGKKYWEYKGKYDKQRQFVLNNPIDLKDIKYTLLSLNDRYDAIKKDDITGIDLDWDINF